MFLPVWTSQILFAAKEQLKHCSLPKPTALLKQPLLHFFLSNFSLASISLYKSITPCSCSQCCCSFLSNCISTHTSCINLLPSPSSCYFRLQPSFLEQDSSCSSREQCRKITIQYKDHLSFCSHRMKCHTNDF